MTDQELKDLVAGLAIAQAKTDEQMKNIHEKLERIKMTLGNNQGAAWEEFFYDSFPDTHILAEDFFYNSLKHTQTLGGIQYDIIYKNMSVQANKIEDYYSIVMINGKDIAIIEVKYKAHESDLEKLL